MTAIFVTLREVTTRSYRLTHAFITAVGLIRLEGIFVYLLVESESESDLHAVVTRSRPNWKFCDVISAIVSLMIIVRVKDELQTCC